jgi:hypothetical protein
MQVGAKTVHLRITSEINLQDASWLEVGEDQPHPYLKLTLWLEVGLYENGKRLNENPVILKIHNFANL